MKSQSPHSAMNRRTPLLRQPVALGADIDAGQIRHRAACQAEQACYTVDGHLGFCDDVLIDQAHRL